MCCRIQTSQHSSLRCGKKIHVNLQSTCYLIRTLDIRADPQKYASQIVRILENFYRTSEMCSLCACSWLLYGDIYRVTSKLSSALNIQHNNKWHGGRKVTDNLLHGH